MRIAVGGLGGIGAPVVGALNEGIDGLELVAVSARDSARASTLLAGLSAPPAIVPLGHLASCADVVVECTPALVYDLVATPAIAHGRTMITLSSGALLTRPELLTRARDTGAIDARAGNPTDC